MTKTPFLQEVPSLDFHKTVQSAPFTAERPTRQEAESAVRTLIRWAGDDPNREGLIDTPKRVVKAYEEFFAGYQADPKEILNKVFYETNNYDEVITLSNIRLESMCEHHIVPIIGKAHVAYLPDKRVIGISKLARLVEIFAKRLQIQEKLTTQIANSINDILQPRGVAVYIEAAHQCITTRGIHKTEASMITTQMLGVFRENAAIRNDFLSMARKC